MMKHYVEPKLVVSKFRDERISTTALGPTPTPDASLLSIPTMGTNVTNSMNKATNSVQGNVSFQDAIKFR